ncbi:type II toxin-antitoxin system HicA family toxin [Methylorubrum thiocyanatum]|uniref:type II toxin-antitoxin system HicA family toxin n=1 Tax=Methylorubrum thiocyanatum TaxID=47958 RepID=UPI0035C7FA9B
MTDYTPALKKLLRQQGYAFLPSGRGDHEVWRNDETGRTVVVDGAIKSRHTANGILKQAGLPKAF